MTDDRQPTYDYYLPAPAPPVAPPVTSTFTSGIPGQAPIQAAPGWSQYAVHPIQPPRHGLPGWVLALIIVGVSIPLTGILAAIAIPVFLSQRMKAEWSSTTVSLPADFNGQPRNTSASAQAVAKTFASGDIKSEDVGIYGAIGSTAVIIVAVKPAAPTSPEGQDVERADLEQGFQAQGGLRLTRQPDAGPLGDWLGCGANPQGVEVCLATGTASLVAVITATGTGDPVAVIRQAQAATVIRG
jgi:hypothetical protein